jgi:GDP-4-dehydro-6-deoxy-D-mannose reductase
MLDLLLGMTKVKVKIEQDAARMRPSDVPVLLGDASKFRKATGWETTIPFEQTLRDLLDYWRAR